MIFDKEIVEEQAKRYDSFYLYDERKIVDSIRRLKQHFPNIEFLYSIKCNSNPYVINSVFAQDWEQMLQAPVKCEKLLRLVRKKRRSIIPQQENPWKISRAQWSPQS